MHKEVAKSWPRREPVTFPPHSAARLDWIGFQFFGGIFPRSPYCCFFAFNEGVTRYKRGEHAFAKTRANSKFLNATVKVDCRRVQMRFVTNRTPDYNLHSPTMMAAPLDCVWKWFRTVALPSSPKITSLSPAPKRPIVNWPKSGKLPERKPPRVVE
jgi:hypothetical protein